jgi:hypothetical protein
MTSAPTNHDLPADPRVLSGHRQAARGGLAYGPPQVYAATARAIAATAILRRLSCTG